MPNYSTFTISQRLPSAAAAFRFFAGGPRPVLEEEEEELSSSTSSPPCKFPCASAPFSLKQLLPRQPKARQEEYKYKKQQNVQAHHSCQWTPTHEGPTQGTAQLPRETTNGARTRATKLPVYSSP